MAQPKGPLITPSRLPLPSRGPISKVLYSQGPISRVLLNPPAAQPIILESLLSRSASSRWPAGLQANRQSLTHQLVQPSGLHCRHRDAVMTWPHPAVSAAACRSFETGLLGLQSVLGK